MQPMTSVPPRSLQRLIGVDLRSDADLVAGVGAGDPTAFEAIMRRHNRLLFRSVRGVLSDDAEAQDAVQETWLRAFTSMKSFRGDAALGTWLVRIALNVAFGAQRKKGRLVALDDLQGDRDAEDAEPSPESVMSDPAGASEWPDAAAERGEALALLQSAIDRLPPIYRSVFMLRAVEEMSVEEAAVCLGVSDAVVKTRFSRARAMLREALAAQLDSLAPQAYAFAGARCDAVVARVLAELRRLGLIRPH